MADVRAVNRNYISDGRSISSTKYTYTVQFLPRENKSETVVDYMRYILDGSKEVSWMQRTRVRVGKTCACYLSARVSTCSRMCSRARIYTTCSPCIHRFATIYGYIYILIVYKEVGLRLDARPSHGSSRQVPGPCTFPLCIIANTLSPRCPRYCYSRRLSWR